MKERVTLTIEQNILESVDKRVDGFKIKNRSHAVELLLMKAMDQSHPKIAFILAGGKGTRLRPITNEIPKPMVPLHDKPILQHALDLFKKYGITEIVMSIGYKGEKIKEYFGNGSRFGVNITYVEETEPLGTAGPLNLARQYLTDTFVMCNADELKNIDLNEMYLFHKDNGALASIALTTVSDPSQYGVAKLTGSKILEFIEKPEAGTAPSNLINAGLYILEPAVLDIVPKGVSSIERDVFPKVATDGKLFGFPFSGQWFDTGTLERYEEAMQKWTDII
jgi:NDP-sugar pyrophosphorylase family protein